MIVTIYYQDGTRESELVHTVLYTDTENLDLLDSSNAQNPGPRRNLNRVRQGAQLGPAMFTMYINRPGHQFTTPLDSLPVYFSPPSITITNCCTRHWSSAPHRVVSWPLHGVFPGLYAKKEAAKSGFNIPSWVVPKDKPLLVWHLWPVLWKDCFI